MITVNLKIFLSAHENLPLPQTPAALPLRPSQAGAQRAGLSTPRLIQIKREFECMPEEQMIMEKLERGLEK